MSPKNRRSDMWNWRYLVTIELLVQRLAF